MPDPFQPRFVDLVRNFTITTGTGNFVLGAAVSGFTSFSTAIVAGESFYYSAIGVDKPAEREVGRGTMQANGSIAREAISGGLTNFTPGAKSIALIAAAEWFNAVQTGSGSGGGSGAPTRAALAALTSQVLPVVLSESGREGIFVFDSSNLTTKVTADPAQAIYVAKSSAPSGASGAWVRRFSGPVNVKWFGAVGDNVTNDGPAFLAAIAYLKSIRIAGFGYGSGSGDLIVPAGRYYLGTNTLDLTHTLRIRGEGTGLTGGGSSILRWAAGASGIRVHAYNTTGATGIRAPDADNSAGSGSSIERLYLQGGYVSPTEGEFHGIHLRGMATISEVFISGFAGNGIHAVAAAGSGGAIEGNTNLTRIEDVTIQFCRVGIFFDSADANACNIVAANVSTNRTWGIWDSSFLGNTYTGCHSAANGWDGALGSIPTACTYSGNRYFVMRDQAVGASTNAPSGTTADNNWWGYQSAGGVYNGIVPWVSGTAFREGGSYRTDDLNARNLFLGCYAEGDQNLAQHQGPTMVVGGLGANGTYLGTLYANNGTVITAGALNVGKSLTVTNDVITTGALDVTGTTSLRDTLYCVKGINAAGTGYVFGPTTLAAADTDFSFRNTNFYNTLSFWSYLGDVPSQDAIIASVRGVGLRVYGYPEIILYPGGTERGRFTSTGLAITGTLSATGAISGSNLSGSNTGDQTIILTGDVTGSGTGSFATTIGAGKVTLGMQANMATASVVYRKTAGSGAPEVQTLATLKTDLGLTGTNSGDQTIALTGNVTGSGSGSFATTIAAGVVTLAMQANMATASVIYRKTAGSGAPEVQTLATLKTDLGLTGTNSGDQTIALTGDVTGSGSGSFAATIGAGAVTYVKIQNVSATSKLLGRASAGAGVVEELGLAGGLAISGSNLTLGALTPTSVAATGAMTTSSPSAGNGYATGAGGAVTQVTSKSTAVTLNNVCGAITMNAATLATVTNVTFTLTNSAIAATDVVVVAIKSGAATAGTYQAWVSATAAGSCTITVRNISAGSLSEALVLNFAINKAVAA